MQLVMTRGFELARTVGSLSGSRAAQFLFWALFGCAIYAATTHAQLATVPDIGDKYQHMAGFAALTALGLWAFPTAGLIRTGERMALFGAAIELVQGLPAIGRSCDLFDWLADLAASFAVLVVAAFAFPPAKRVSGD
jgi:hypothetical protein